VGTLEVEPGLTGGFVRLSALAVLVILSGMAFWGRIQFAASASAQSVQTSGPQYDSTGALERPKNFETWVFVGASTGLSYQEESKPSGMGSFHNVYLRPESYEAYLETGQFPEKTMLVLAIYDPAQKVEPAHGGYFEGQFAALDVAVKDHEHFPSGWAYFNFGQRGNLAEAVHPVEGDRCFTCHKERGADDNVFVQFYPILRRVFESHKPGVSSPGP
jgi:hypothetical protein